MSAFFISYKYLHGTLHNRKECNMTQTIITIQSECLSKKVDLQAVHMTDIWTDEILQIVQICKLRNGLAFAFISEDTAYWKDLVTQTMRHGLSPCYMSFETERFRLSGNFFVVSRDDGTFSICSDENLRVSRRCK